MKPKGAIFDMDGTLIDSMHVWLNLGNEYLVAKGYIPKPDLLEKLKSMSLYQAAQYLKEEYRLSFSKEDIIRDINEMIVNHYRFTIPLKPFAEQFLSKLNSMDVKMCVATATDHILAKAALDRLGISHFFDGIITPKETGIGKDNPVFYLKALELLKTAVSDTMVFEDSLHAIKSAKQAGFYVVGVYDKIAFEDSEEIKAISDSYVYSFDQWEMDEG